MSDPSTTTLLLLGLAGLAAGFVDAVVGGGGLIQLPALLLGLPSAAPATILGTNKLSSICGTTVSSATYYRRIRPDPRTFGPLMACAFVGSVGGAFVGSHISAAAFDPIVLVVLIVVGGYVLFRPALGETTVLRFGGVRHTGAAMGTGLAIGFYDGALGPGTGSFFVITLVGLLGYSFLEASAKARLANWATNLGRALRLRAPGRRAVEGRAGDGRPQPGRRLRRCAYGGRARHRLRPGVLRDRRVGVHRPDRRRGPRPVVSRNPGAAGPHQD